MNLAISHLMTAQGARRRGFPVRPRPGQTVNYGGQTWVWFPPNVFESGLGDEVDGLGFWGALIGAAISGGMSLFGGGKKGDAEARAALEKQQADIARLQAEIDKKPNSIWNKKTMTIIGLVLLGALALKS